MIKLTVFYFLFFSNFFLIPRQLLDVKNKNLFVINCTGGLAEVVSELTSVAGKDLTTQKLIPMITELIKDENHEVRLAYSN